jgi:hypothetical protein
VTHDRAQTWQMVAANVPSQVKGTCLLTVDHLGPNIAVYSVECPCQTITYSSFITLDGGLTWRSRGGGMPPYALYTANGLTYFVRSSVTAQQIQVQSIAVSGDGLRTWRSVGPRSVGPRSSNSILGFWADPASGTLLAWLHSGDVGNDLWSSRDAGAHWGQLPGPAALGFTVRAPVGGQSWDICSAAFDPSVNRSSTVTCSFDGGYTWASRAHLPTQLKWPEIIAIARDGTLLAQGSTDVSQPGDQLFYRLMPRSSTWQLLSTIPPIAVSYTTGPGAGLLWLYPALQTRGSYPSASDGRVYIATYLA